MKKCVLISAISTAMVLSTAAEAGVASYNWDGFFTLLDPGGAAFANGSITGRGANSFRTPISGTMDFDTVSGAGTATVVPFDFLNGTAPAEVTSMNMQAIGDGMGGSGTLILGNMLFNWNGTNGMPISIVLDAAGFFNSELTAGGANSATPASDGTYANSTFGYLNLGPVPIATTAWNTTDNCTNGVDCMGNGTSGILPLVFDTATNTAYDTANTGGAIGGSPMLDGPFIGNNANFDITLMTPVLICDFEPSQNCPPPPVPVPAAVWLFGSGLLGLIGVARRKRL